jgi:hypothetical protein
MSPPPDTDTIHPMSFYIRKNCAVCWQIICISQEVKPLVHVIGNAFFSSDDSSIAKRELNEQA